MRIGRKLSMRAAVAAASGLVLAATLTASPSAADPQTPSLSEAQRKVAELSSQGLSVIFISSELEEVLRLAQRVVVMRDRRQIGVLNSRAVDVNGLIDYMANEGEGRVA